MSIDNLRHAQYGSDGIQIDDPQNLTRMTDGQIQAWMSGAGVRTPIAAAIAKWFGGTHGGGVTFNAVGNKSGGTFSFGYKHALDAPFVAVRVVLVNRTGAAQSNWRITVGVTESALVSSNDETSQVKVGGSFYKVAVTAGSNLGHVPATFAGSATVNIGSGASEVAYAISDRIPLTSVPRADGSAYPLIIVRADYDATTVAAYAQTNGAAAAMNTVTAANRGKVMAFFGGTAMAATPSNSGINGNAAHSCWEMFVLPEYSTPTLSLMQFDDSTGQGDALVATDGVFCNWGWRAAADASTSSRVFSYANMGMSSHTSATYWARAKAMFAAGIIPDCLLIGPASVNDNFAINPDSVVALAKARAVEILAVCRQYGIRNVAFRGVMPSNILSAGNDAYRTAWNAWLNTFCVSFGIGYIDIAGLGNGASPEQWIPAYNYTLDGLHPNTQAMEDFLVPRTAAWLRSVPF